MTHENPIFIALYALKQRVNELIPAPEIKDKKHQKTFEEITHGIPWYVAVVEITGTTPIYFCQRGLDYLGLKSLGYSILSNEFFHRVLHRDNWGIIPTGVSHFISTPDDFLPFFITVKRADGEWRQVYTVSLNLYDAPALKGKYTISLVVDVIDSLKLNSYNGKLALTEADYRKLLLLNQREREVLQLIAQEYSSEQMADILKVSKHTIESNRKSLLKKLEVKGVAGLVKAALKYGMAGEE